MHTYRSSRAAGARLCCVCSVVLCWFAWPSAACVCVSELGGVPCDLCVMRLGELRDLLGHLEMQLRAHAAIRSCLSRSRRHGRRASAFQRRKTSALCIWRRSFSTKKRCPPPLVCTSFIPHLFGGSLSANAAGATSSVGGGRCFQRGGLREGWGGCDGDWTVPRPQPNTRAIAPRRLQTL